MVLTLRDGELSHHNNSRYSASRRYVLRARPRLFGRERKARALRWYDTLNLRSPPRPSVVCVLLARAVMKDALPFPHRPRNSLRPLFVWCVIPTYLPPTAATYYTLRYIPMCSLKAWSSLGIFFLSWILCLWCCDALVLGPVQTSCFELQPFAKK